MPRDTVELVNRYLPSLKQVAYQVYMVTANSVYRIYNVTVDAFGVVTFPLRFILFPYAEKKAIETKEAAKSTAKQLERTTEAYTQKSKEIIGGIVKKKREYP